jgi:hypothetical protein
LHLDFIGPDVVQSQESIQLQHPTTTSSGTLTLQWYHSGYFHNLPPDHVPNWDGFVLFNPGLGHDNLRSGWKPTLDVLLRQQRRRFMLLTAHSELDAKRDAKVLRDEYDWHVMEYEENPFASRITYVDPLSPNKRHLVQPNLYAAMIII